MTIKIPELIFPEHKKTDLAACNPHAFPCPASKTDKTRPVPALPGWGPDPSQHWISELQMSEPFLPYPARRLFLGRLWHVIAFQFNGCWA
jgi:hypothetical protein